MVEHKTTGLLEEVLKRPVADKEMFRQKKTELDQSIGRLNEQDLSALLLYLENIEDKFSLSKKYNRTYQDFIKSFRTNRETDFPDLPLELFPNNVKST